MKKNIVIDAHTHIGFWPHLSSTENMLLSLMKEQQITYGIFSIDNTEYLDNEPLQNKITVKKTQIELNSYALKFAKKNRNLFMLLWVKPSREYRTKSIEALDSLIAKNRRFIYGLKIHPWCSRIRMDDKRIEPFLALARKYSLPICVHTAKDKYSDIHILEKVAKENADINFIAAHIQLCSDNQEGLEIIKNNPNIYGDTAWVNISTVLKAISMGLEDKIMFGSDCPIDKERTYKEDIYQDYLKNRKKIKRSTMEKVMYKNAQKVYHLILN